MPNFISERVKQIKPSPTLSLTARAQDMLRAGEDLIILSMGEPDFDTPEYIRNAAINAINRGYTRYTDVSGTKELKEAIQRKFVTQNKLEYALNQISVGSGAKQVIYNALMATLNPDDEVIIPAPYWVSYPDMATILGGKPVIIPTNFEQKLKINPAQLQAAITPRTKWFIFNSPSNPSGMGYSYNEILEIAKVLVEHPHVLILSDDIYEHLAYDDFTFYTIAQVEPQLFDRTLTVNGVSKSHAMTGWRIGYGGGPEWLIKAMTKVQSQTTSNPCSISQAAAKEALLGDQCFIVEWQEIYATRRDIVYNGFAEIPGFKCHKPQGTFYMYLECSDILGKTTPDGTKIASDSDLAEYFLNHAKVAVVPGSAFGASPYLRVSFSCSTEELDEGIRRIKEACTALS